MNTHPVFFSALRSLTKLLRHCLSPQVAFDTNIADPFDADDGLPQESQAGMKRSFQWKMSEILKMHKSDEPGKTLPCCLRVVYPLPASV